MTYRDQWLLDLAGMTLFVILMIILLILS